MTKTDLASLKLSILAVADIDETTLAGYLGVHVPKIIAAAQEIFADADGDGDRDLDWSKVPGFVELVSRTVKFGLPMVSADAAYGVVEAAIKWAFETFVVPRLPVFLAPFAGVVLTSILGLIEGVYRTRVKPALK